MAVLRGKPWIPRREVASGKIMVDTVRGTIRVRKWPRRRGHPVSEKQLFWIDWFRQANMLARYVDPMTRVRAIELTQKWPLYPRDLILKAMRGRLYTWNDSNGWRWFPVAAQNDISESLDVLAQTIGSVLVRAPDRWRAAIATTFGQVLMWNGTIAAPSFETLNQGDLKFGGAMVTKSANQSIVTATITPLTFDVEEYDTDDIHDNVTNPSRLTVPTGWKKVRLAAGVVWQASGVGSRQLILSKNGNPFPGHAQHDKLAVGNSQDSVATGPIPCVTGDYFEFQVWQNTGGNLVVPSPQNNVYFSMERVE